MPAANLQFKRGPLAALGDQAVADGTIYVTTDEGAMYVDVGNQRIRLGDFIPVNTLADLQNQSPLYETAVYYVKEGNILARYDITNQRWIQINKSGVVAVANASGNAGVGNVISDISLTTDANGQLTLVLTRASVSTSTSLEQVQSDISELQRDMTKLKGNASTTGSILNIVEAAKATLLGNPTTYTTIEALETALAAVKTTADGAASAAATNASDISQLQSDVGDLERVIGASDAAGLRKKVKDAEDALALLNNSDATVQGSVKYAVAQGIAAVVANADASYDTLKEIADWILSDTTGAAKMASDIQQAGTDIAELQRKVTAAETNLAGLMADANTSGSILNLIAAEASARATEDTRLAGLISDNASDISDLETDVGELRRSLTWKEFTVSNS